jgi:diguanylate cyclase (GGDEF)-like protein
MTTRRRTKSGSDREGDPPASAEALEALRQENADLRQSLSVVGDLRSRLGHLAEKLAMLTRLSQELNDLDIDRIAQVAVEKIPLMLNAKYCSFFLYNYQTNELVLKRHNHAQELHPRVAIRHHQNTIMGLALRTRRVVFIRDIEEYEREHEVQFERTFADKYATRSCICAPLMAGNFIVGILNFADRRDEASFEELEDLPVVEQVGQILGMAVRNCNLFKEVQNQARTDSLTKLANYRAFHEILRGEIRRSVRYVRPLALLMIDLDNFKGINDRFGHPAGDFALKEVSQIIRGYVRREDLAARYGGDELAVILPETPLAGARIVAERILDLVRSHPFTWEGGQIPISLSMGLAELSPEMSLADFVKAADEALYEAKQKGKNRVAVVGTAE